MYGCCTDISDKDIMGITIPRKEDVFPHLKGEIVGFDDPRDRFEQWQSHDIKDPNTGIRYDLNIYSIVKYFRLAMSGNPNTLEILFAPRDCVLHTSLIGELIREHRKLFLHKGSYFKHRGYCFAQLSRAKSQNKTGKRKAAVDEHGFDPKSIYHVYRLIDQCEQILLTGDLDLRRISEQLKVIRQGNYTIDEVEAYFTEKEKYLNKLYESTSTIPDRPDVDKIKTLLVKCLEMHFADLSNCVRLETNAEKALDEIKKIITYYS
jgi:predicted nucleotidyltransferase